MDIKTKEILRSLAVTANYRGYHQTVAACKIICDDELRLYNVSQYVYPYVASVCGCNVTSIERDIRTIIIRAWRLRHDRLCEIAGFTLSSPPTVIEFLSILTSYLTEMANDR